MVDQGEMAMRRVTALEMLVAASALISVQGAKAQSMSAEPNTARPPAVASAPVISPQAAELLKQMGAYIASANEFTFHADVTFDHVLPSGQKLQYEADEDVALQRPDRLYVEWTGDLGDRRFWYDGKSVALYDPSTPFYATQSAPPAIDEMLKKVISQLGFSPPLADFLYHDPYHAVANNIQFGLYLGTGEVNGRQCESLAFVEKDVDWQIWIETEPRVIPCKLVITYKTQPSQPQFSAVFTDWNFSPRIAESVFTPILPPDTEKVPFVQAGAGADQQ
jgi:hypothetical protein